MMEATMMTSIEAAVLEIEESSGMSHQGVCHTLDADAANRAKEVRIAFVPPVTKGRDVTTPVRRRTRGADGGLAKSRAGKRIVTAAGIGPAAPDVRRARASHTRRERHVRFRELREVRDETNREVIVVAGAGPAAMGGRRAHTGTRVKTGRHLRSEESKEEREAVAVVVIAPTPNGRRMRMGTSTGAERPIHPAKMGKASCGVVGAAVTDTAPHEETSREEGTPGRQRVLMGKRCARRAKRRCRGARISFWRRTACCTEVFMEKMKAPRKRWPRPGPEKLKVAPPGKRVPPDKVDNRKERDWNGLPVQQAWLRRLGARMGLG
jgi:hypothetical protein